MGCSQSQQENKDESLKIHRKTSDKSESKKKTIEAKIVLLGDQHVGKSSIAQRYVNDVFTGQHVATIGGAYLQKKVILANGIAIKLHLWDTGGQERFRAMANLYYRDANAAILTYDVTNEYSFKSVEYWLNELRYKINEDGLILCLAGNKCDVTPNERKVEYEKAKMLADEHKMIFFETSAKTNVGVEELFKQLSIQLYEQKGMEDRK